MTSDGAVFLCTLAEPLLMHVTGFLDDQELARLTTASRRIDSMFCRFKDPTRFMNSQLWRCRVWCFSPHHDLSAGSLDPIQQEQSEDSKDPQAIYVSAIHRIPRDDDGDDISTVHSVGKLPANLLSNLVGDLSQTNWRRVFVNLHNLFPKKSILMLDEVRGIHASSTDGQRQGIDQTLNDWRSTFWSSKGSSARDGKDVLIYQFSTLTVLTSIRVTPFRATYQPGMPTFAPKAVQVTCALDEEFKMITFSTNALPLQNTGDHYEVSFNSFLVLGQYVRLNLLGKYQKQKRGGLYFVALERVRFFGTMQDKATNVHGLLETVLVEASDSTNPIRS
eukprot:TRINITY_DN1030_c0_g1_i2.p1 TRINITY_DN1030_c0_g1~~TRINITY_DN1030_c0_g1_i2.p1  ORF type:complete len:334 (-),score=60.80 TRINITY_DN1030_c0_g1_i2:99-1100(-)